MPGPVDLSTFGWFDEGHGDPILLLHSSGASSRQWARLREPWGERYRTLGLDLWGYGSTPLPTGAEDFRLSHEVDLARALLTRVDEPVHLIGHSYGGAVALRLALDAPELVRSISVHEPVLFHLLREPGSATEWAEIHRISDAVLLHVESGRPAQAASIFVDYWNGEGAWRALNPAQQERMAVFAKKAPLDFSALFHEDEPLAAYRGLEDKAIITVGESTRSPASRVAELLGGAFGSDSRHILAGAGHMAPITRPELLRPLIEAHLAAH